MAVYSSKQRCSSFWCTRKKDKISAVLVVCACVYWGTRLLGNNQKGLKTEKGISVAFSFGQGIAKVTC